MDKIPTAGSKSICLPTGSEAEYSEAVSHPQRFRSCIDQLIERYPGLFPSEIDRGYWLHDIVRSKKQQLSMRRIKVVATGEVYQVRPDFVMPYMIGKTDEVEKGLYLRRWGVPFEALAYVFGRDENYWYRAYQGLGRFSLVGTTVRDPDSIPVHLLADEKHSRWWGNQVYIPTTVAEGCILGVDMVRSASADDLKEGYETFQQEALQLNPAYRPVTFNTDGWDATQQVLKALFPGIILVGCFLHVVLGIQRHCRRAKTLFTQVTDKLWRVYRAQTKRQFAQRLRRLKEWAYKKVENEKVQQKLLNLEAKADSLKVAYEFPEAYRTSNALDRLMNYQDRLLYNMQYFHGTWQSARLQLRAMALIWNFHPYGRRTRSKDPDRSSPFGELNGFSYHENWLRNLLIAGSMNGY